MVEKAQVQTLHDFLKLKPAPFIEGQEPEHDISYQWVRKNEELKLIEDGIPFEEFSEAINQRNLEMEFRLMRRMTESTYHCQNLRDFDPNLNKMNRYSNIIPFTHTEVSVPKFKSEIDESDEYINANYINNCFNERVFIATQGPLEITFSNFWKMVCSESIELIVMLCNLQENGRSQCEHYWPSASKSLDFPPGSAEKQLKISLESEKDIGNKIIERVINIESNLGKSSWEKKTVRQLQWIGWPDHGVPTDSDHDIIKALLDKMLEFYLKSQGSKKIVIHCSAGVGRTGTLISLFNLSLTLTYFERMFRGTKDAVVKKNCKLSVFGTVRRLREQRWGMVNTSEQYGYIYRYMKKAIEEISN